MTELVFKKDLNLTEVVWRSYGKPKGEKLPPPHQHRWTEAAEGSGEWSLSPHDVVRIGYRPGHPEFGLDRRAIMDEQRAYEKRTKQFMRDPRRVGRYQAMLGIRTEHSYAESMEEARMLCQALENGSDGLPPFEEGLANLGFAEYVTPPAWRSPRNFITYERTIKSGTFSVTIHKPEFDDIPHGSIHCTYSGDGCNYWHNVFNIEMDFLGHDKETRCYIFWPEASKDLRVVAVAHLAAVLEKRLARARTRLSTPLGGKLPRE